MFRLNYEMYRKKASFSDVVKSQRKEKAPKQLDGYNPFDAFSRIEPPTYESSEGRLGMRNRNRQFLTPPPNSIPDAECKDEKMERADDAEFVSPQKIQKCDSTKCSQTAFPKGC